MNIAIFASAFHPHTGGVEELCRQLAIEYRRREMGVIILTNRWPRGLARYEEIEGVPVHRLAMRVAGESVKSKLSAALTAWMIRRQMIGILRDFDPDVLHVQCVSSNAAYALMARNAFKVPLVVTLQGELTMDASQLFQRAKWARSVLRKALEQADAITACSANTIAEGESWLGRAFGDRGQVIFNGISIADAATASPHLHRRPYVLAIGRHVPQKGFDVLLRAMGVLVKDPAFDHDLILAGDGIETGSLKRLVGDLQLKDRVWFPGRVDHGRAMQLFAGCSFFVLPSRHEPFGIVNLEAMAAGKAIIATNVGGVSEIVSDGINGILVPPGEAAALSAAMKLLSVDSVFRDRLGTSGQQKVGDFAWPVIAGQYEELYRAVLRAAAA